LPDNCISNNDFEIVEFDGKKNKIHKLFSLIQKETSQNESTFLSVQAKAFILLDEITKLFPSGENNKQKKSKDLLLDEIYLYIGDNYEIKLTLDELSKRFFISKSRLSHEFKKEYGISPIDYLIGIRLEKAKALLLKTDKSIVDIAFKCGFSSSNYFSDHFKKRYGESPTSYRKNKKQ
jgi:AraC-like DNA-binding protein